MDTKTKTLKVRLRPMQLMRLQSDAGRLGFRTVAEYVVATLLPEGKGEVKPVPTRPVPVALPPVHGGSQSDRAAYARSLLATAKPEVAHTVQVPIRSGGVERCEHGLIAENCDVCTGRC